MASLPLSTTTTKLSTTHPQNKPSVPKTSHISLHRSRSKFVVSCNNQDPNAPNAENAKNLSTTVDRRNMLLGLGGLYGAAATTIGGRIPASLAEPIAPDVSACSPTRTNPNGPGSTGLQCCLNFQGQKIEDFKFANYKTFLKARMPIGKAGAKNIKDFNKAIGMMRELPPNDPRSLHMQALIHCAYCDGVYNQLDHTDKQYEVHMSALFYPFHRWYLYFFERIAGDLIGNPYFALPYWAWDSREGMTVPSAFMDPINYPFLNDDTRNKDRVKGVVDLNFFGRGNNTVTITDAQLMEENLKLVAKQVVGVRTEQFMGRKYVSGGASSPGAGSIEAGAHTIVHAWTGGNIGKFSTAGKDPLFYAHHGNVDRLWYLWNALYFRSESKQNSTIFDDNDFLDSSFIFYDEKCRPVRVKVRDSFNTWSLGYDYPWGPTEWMPAKGSVNRSIAPGPATRRRGGRGGRRGFVHGSHPVSLPSKLDSVLRTTVKRPRKSRSEEEKKVEEEVIVVDIEMSGTTDSMIKFDVYINDEFDHKPHERSMITEEYVGSFSTLPMGHIGNVHSTTLKLGLNRVLEELGVEDDEELQVTLVPRSGLDSIVITSIKIDYS